VSRRPSFKFLGICLSILTIAGVALACQVPVFRFALERWVADPYEIRVAPGASGKFSPDEQAAIDFLKANQLGSASNETGVFANLSLSVSEEAAENASPAATLTIGYPRQIRGYEVKPIWEGVLSLENAKRLIDSPIRRELVKRLLTGESAVWVLVESGNPEADKAAAETIEAAAKRSIEVLKIPDGVMTREEAESATNFAAINADDILQSEVPLKIDFSLLRVSRDDAAEALFLPMMLNIEDDLGDFSKEPMVFPVFGRGRLLEPLIGRGINEDNALEYATYICGACSCEVKDQNPGQDLLVAADWDSALEGSEVVIEKILPPLEGTGILAQAAAASAASEETTAEETEPSPDAGDPAAPTGDPASSPGGIMIGPAVLAVVILFLFIGIGTLILLRKKSP
jgi:hypothetical protein